MWNNDSKKLSKNTIYVMTPTDIRHRPIIAGTLSTHPIGARLILRSRDSKLTVDPPALISPTADINSEDFAQFLHISEKNVTISLGQITRREFCVSSGQTIMTRQISLLAANDRALVVTSEPAWERVILEPENDSPSHDLY